MEAATNAKLEAEKRAHERALRGLENQIRDMGEKLRQVSGLNGKEELVFSPDGFLSVDNIFRKILMTFQCIHR